MLWIIERDRVLRRCLVKDAVDAGEVGVAGPIEDAVDDELESMLQDGMLVVQDINVALWAGGRPEEVLSGLSVHAEKLASHGLL